MKKWLGVALSMALAFAVLGAPPASAQAYGPGGSWQASCRNPQAYGSVFSASCTATNGQWVRSSINLASCPGGLLGNNNGHLFCEGGGARFGNVPGGSWQRSCSYTGNRGATVFASCSNGHGMQATSFNMRACPGWALGNSNGNLFCEAGGANFAGGGYPGGSWQNSCRSPGINGPMFSAQCTNNNSAYRYSVINLNACPSRLVGNRNGALFCEY